MPWCPKCKNEYKEGISVCADCGCELKEGGSTPEIPVTFGTEEEMERLGEFLEYSGVSPVYVRYCKEENVYELAVEAGREKEAAKLTAVFVRGREAANAAAETEAQDSPAADGASAGLYQDSAERAEENRSSAYVLIVTGSAGLLFMILEMVGVLPAFLSSSTTQYMVYGVMSALFLLFIVMGFISMKSSRVFARKAESENSLKDTMEKWCLENLDAAALDREAFSGEEGLTEEVKYFRRTELVKEKIKAQFMNLDAQFLEHFTDEIYGDIFEEEDGE